MLDRIRELLEARQLSPTQFADEVGVARPTISHILSGRNKPSLEVVQKILAAYPDLSMAWLLNGTGAMVAVPMPPAASVPAPAEAAPSTSRSRRAATPTGAVPVASPTPPPTPTVAEAPAAGPSAQPAPAPEPFTAPTAPAMPAAAPVAPVGALPELAMLALPGKRIRRIVIFYHDGTFADFQPE